MREIRKSGSEGGGAEFNRPSLPLSRCRRIRGETHTGCGLRMVAASGIFGRAAELRPVS